MPVALRRIHSTCSNSSIDCPVTPSKRRRIKLAPSNEESEKFAMTSGGQHGQVDSAACKQPCVVSEDSPKDEAKVSAKPSAWTVAGFANETPSRRDGISEEAERMQRMLVCDAARSMVRDLFEDGSASAADLDELSLCIQMSACYLVQVYFMFASLSRSDVAAVAKAGVSVALSIGRVGLKCSVDEGSEETSGQETSEDSVLQVERRLRKYLAEMRCIPSDFLSLPAHGLGSIADVLLLNLPGSQAFQASPAIVTDVILRAKLVCTAQCFQADGMMGVGALFSPPHVMAASALALASRHVLRQAGVDMSSEELFSMVECAAAASMGVQITQEELRQAVEEGVAVSRLWKESCAEAPLVMPCP